MSILKCKICGGDMEISADRTFGTCEYCGSTMTLPKIGDDVRAAVDCLGFSVGQLWFCVRPALWIDLGS